MRTRWRPPQSAGRQAKPSVFDVKGPGGLVRTGALDEIKLPLHVVNRIERRWTVGFAQVLQDWQRPGTRLRHPPTKATILSNCRKFGGCWRIPEDADGG